MDELKYCLGFATDPFLLTEEKLLDVELERICERLNAIADYLQHLEEKIEQLRTDEQ